MRRCECGHDSSFHRFVPPTTTNGVGDCLVCGCIRFAALLPESDVLPSPSVYFRRAIAGTATEAELEEAVLCEVLRAGDDVATSEMDNVFARILALWWLAEQAVRVVAVGS